MIDERERPVLLLDVSGLRGRRDAQDGERVEPLDLSVVRHGVHEVEEASPPRDQRQQLIDRYIHRFMEQHRTGRREKDRGLIERGKEGRGDGDVRYHMDGPKTPARSRRRKTNPLGRTEG